jgi:hypothetical protein
VKTVHLQMLLKKAARNPAGVQDARAAAASVGMRPTASGRATVSAEATPDVFHRLFEAPADDAPGAATEPRALTVPAELEHVVEQISIAPRHRHMG